MRKPWRSLCRGKTSINAHYVETSIRPQSNQVASSERSRNAMGDNNVTTRLTIPPPLEPIGCPTPGACSCVPPLPEEIAGLIEGAEERIQRGPGHAGEDLHLM